MSNLSSVTTSMTSSYISGSSKRKRSPEIYLELSEIRKPFNSRKRQHLRIDIPSSSDIPVDSVTSIDHHEASCSPISGLSEPDSLFDEPVTTSSSGYVACPSTIRVTPALLTAPLIRGLFFMPTLRLPQEIADSVTRFCLNTYFQVQGVNQVMLFGRFFPPQAEPSPPSMTGTMASTSSTGLPPILLHLLATLDTMLLPSLPPETHALLFPRVPSRARQAILNLYQPGEGITPHVDLLRRYGDGIVGVSLGSGCVMQFARVVNDAPHKPPEQKNPKDQGNWDLYLPERSVIVLSEDARYGWTHGIGKHREDYVAAAHISGEQATSTGTWIERGVRLSITFRWMLPGADVVGDDGPGSP
ncbi:hypothetical protein Hypma_013039 [Hypsizygus marmoreus]|uniref:Fe2OG dioxygenase domain-containing protein n=1 Tax=Hypsizygus marmoreus TaxID=39966 RepID=A0A369JCX2_HYPMA|nr:hypothetical protein Hypma_013039 [Hypsizygus marmoreus]